MTITNIQLITDALLEIGVINESETPSAEQGQQALRKLNQMMEALEEEGINLGWHEQPAADIQETAPLPPYAENGITLKLALALAPSYGGAASVSPTLAADMLEAWAPIERKAALNNLKERRMDNMPSSQGGTFDMTTGMIV